MTTFTCPTCNARVIDTDPHSDAYEAEVARHMDGVCFGAGGAA